jgi:hypothetical protein
MPLAQARSRSATRFLSLSVLSTPLAAAPLLVGNGVEHAPALAAGINSAPVATSGVAAPAPTWSRTYGGVVSEQGLHALRQLPNGRLVAAGYTASFGGPSQFSWLLGLDLSSGDVQVERASSSALGGYTDGAGIAADGGALFLGRDVLDIQTKHDAWLQRVDASGQVLWSVGFTRPGTGRHFLFDAAELPDGSWIAVGATGVLDFPPQAAWVVRLSASGALLWQSEYGAGVADTARAVAPCADGGFALVGATNSSGAGDDDLWAMKLDASGAIEWQRTFGGGGADRGEDIVELDDGSLAIVGATDSFTASGHAPWVLRLGANGALLWHRIVDGGVWGDLEGVARANDGQIVVVGRVAEPGFPTNDLWCAKLAASNGRVLWQRAYDGGLGDFGSVVLPLVGPGANTDYVVGGVWGFGFPSESVWLSRTDRLGGLGGCGGERTTNLPVVRPSIAVAAGLAVREVGEPQLEQPGAQEAASSATVIDMCQ